MISRLLAIQVFLYPLLFLSIDGVTPAKVIGVFLLFLVLLRAIRADHRAHVPVGWKPTSLMTLFVAYTIGCQLVFGMAGMALYGDLPASGGSEPSVRLATQLVASLQLFAFCWLLYEFAQRAPGLPSKAFRLSMLLMIATGIYEIFSIYVGGPAVPLTLAGSEAMVNQNFSALLGARRLHGLAGEPRFFAVLAVMLLNALIYTVIARQAPHPSSGKRYRVAIFVGAPILLVLIFQTQSSSGLIMLVLLPLATLLIVKRSFATTARFAIISAVIAIGFAPLLSDLFATRVVERIAEEVISDQHWGAEHSAYVEVPVLGWVALDATDATPMALLVDKPLFAITGLGVGNISTYVKPYLPHYGGYWGYGFTGIVEPNLGALKAILNHGVIGNLMLILIFSKFVRHYRRHSTAYSDRELFSFFLCTGSILSTYLFTAPFISAFAFLSFHAGLIASFNQFANGTAR